jgi:hypothetical protein
MNSKMVKSIMRILTGREKTDMTDTNVSVAWKLQHAAEIIVGEIKRES